MQTRRAMESLEGRFTPRSATCEVPIMNGNTGPQFGDAVAVALVVWDPSEYPPSAASAPLFQPGQSTLESAGTPAPRPPPNCIILTLTTNVLHIKPERERDRKSAERELMTEGRCAVARAHSGTLRHRMHDAVRTTQARARTTSTTRCAGARTTTTSNCNRSAGIARAAMPYSPTSTPMHARWRIAQLSPISSLPPVAPVPPSR